MKCAYRRNLSPDAALRFAMACGLNESEVRYAELRQIIKQFRQELHQRMESSGVAESAERVVQVSVHVFPLSKKLQRNDAMNTAVATGKKSETQQANLRSSAPRGAAGSRSSKKVRE